jgi:hypothetical protein
MSRTATATNKFYCKVCQDAGKPESVFRSHFTRESKDPNSKVCCPTLLSLECRYCFKQGHTVKYCKLLKSNEKKKNWLQEKQKSETKSVNILSNENKKKLANKFAYLDDDEDEDQLENNELKSQETKVVEEFPQLCAPSKRTISPNNNLENGYVNALNKVQVALPESVPVRIAPLTNKSNKKKVSIFELNWAMTEDSDEEDEDEDTQENYEYIYEKMNDYSVNADKYTPNVYSDDDW